MGRYYSGDIEGKFWFAVQSSNAASRFGGFEYEPEYINYSFESEAHLENVEEELKRIEEMLGSKMKVLDSFFEKCNGYNEDMLVDEYKKHDLDDSNVHLDLVNYADYGLGKQILQCLLDNGFCDFQAEL